jgi:hypothetical protein
MKNLRLIQNLPDLGTNRAQFCYAYRILEHGSSSVWVGGGRLDAGEDTPARSVRCADSVARAGSDPRHLLTPLFEVSCEGQVTCL